VISVLPNNQNSSINQYNLQISRQLPGNTVVNVAYVGTKADHLMTWFKYNNPQLAGAAAVFPGRGLDIQVGDAGGTSKYNGLQTSLNRRMTNGFQFTMAYTWSHTLDNSNGAFSTTNGNGRIFIDPTQGGALLRDNYGNSDQDQRHIFSFSSLYELPFGKGKQWGSSWNNVTDEVLGGWQVNSLIALGTGTPFDVTVNGLRPDYKGGVTVGSETQASNGNVVWLNVPANAFAAAPNTRPGTLARNYFHGPGYRTVDASIFKNFTITERVKAEFRTEAFNLLNTPQFVNPNTDLGGFNNGLPSNTNFGQINGTRQKSERQIQFALRFTF